MKVGIVAFSGMFPFKYGGPQEVVYHLIKESLRCSDFEFKIFLRLYRQSNSFFNEIPFRDAERVEVRPLLVKKGEEVKLIPATMKILLHSLDCELIYYNSPPYFFDLPLLRLLRKPVIYDFHGGLFAEEMFEDRPYLRAIVPFLKSHFKIFASMSTYVITHSDYMKKKAIIFGVPKEKIKVIPLGINVEEFKKAKITNLAGDPSLLFVGRLEKIKGPHILLKALPRIISEFPELRLYIVGEGSLKRELGVLTKKLNLSSNVTFVGNVSREKLLSMYKSTDICVFPSTYNEGFGVTVLEAMAAGKPVIASATGGMKERIISGYDGFLVKRNDSTDLSRKILIALHDSSLRQKLSMNASRTAIKYSWRKISKRYCNLFKEVVNVENPSSNF